VPVMRVTRDLTRGPLFPLACLALACLGACSTPAPTPTPTAGTSGQEAREAETPAPPLRPTPQQIRPRRVWSVADVPNLQPEAGHYRVHMIDVGTGLAILVQGADFTLLYDGGTNDRAEQGSLRSQTDETRLLSYLFAALGPSGDADCAPPGDTWSEWEEMVEIDHVVLSHPHNDHGNMLDSVLNCYDVGTVWDAGHVNETAFLHAFYGAVAAHAGVQFRTVRPVPSDRRYDFGRRGQVIFPPGLDWSTFGAGHVETLGAGASFTVVHADHVVRVSDPNECSIVLRVDLGARSLLLTGDVESSPGHARPRRSLLSARSAR